jgi:pimeloyl-ACP methyl ester carboxylesterase
MEEDVMSTATDTLLERAVTIPAGEALLNADLAVPPGARGIVLFAHGSGSSRTSPRNRSVAAALQQAHFATLLLDLLTLDEEHIDSRTGQLRFDIPLLATLPIAYFGASTGAAAALVAATAFDDVQAIVSRGGRPDMAGRALEAVRAPTLLIVGGYDEPVLDLNRDALARMRCVTALRIVPYAGHLFEEQGAMGQVIALARAWFEQHVGRHASSVGSARFG